MTLSAQRLERGVQQLDRNVWPSFIGSRLLAWVAGVFGFLQVSSVSGVVGTYDPTNLTSPFGSALANALVAPLARWDSVWYLSIAHGGYAANPERMAFFPLYPLAIHVLGWVVQSQLAAGVLISLTAFAVALLLLRRLIALDFPEEVANATVLLVAFGPMAFFFSAVYTESLFLALSVGAIYAARREGWWLAGVLGFLAAMSRNGGFILALPLAVIYLYGPRGDLQAPTTRWASSARAGLRRLLPRYRLGRGATWILLVPAGLGAFLAYLGLQYGRALAPFQSETFWYRHTTFFAITIVHAASAAAEGVRQLLQGPNPPYRVVAYASDITGSAAQDVILFVFLLLGLVALGGALRRQPPAYSLYALAMLVLALSDPVKPQPLASLPRYEMVVFPLFLWAAQLLASRRLLLTSVLGSSAVLLGVFTVEFATWRWVA